MRADICDADDPIAIEQCRAALRRLGARVVDSDWAIGVDLYRVQIGAQEVIVYSDAYALDIEGPDDLVRRVVIEYGRRAGGGDA